MRCSRSCRTVVCTSKVRRPSWGMCGALRLEPSGLSFSAGLRGRLLSLLHQCKCVLGILGRYSAGGLGLQSARVASGDTASNELHRFQGFHWACFLGWAVQHRISQWWALQGGSQNQEWVKFAALNFCFVAVSSLWVLAFTHSLWNKKPRTRIQPFLPPLWRSFLVYLLIALTFFRLFTYAVLPLVPAITTWYAFGVAWALFVGTWQWRALHAEKRVVVGPGFR